MDFRSNHKSGRRDSGRSDGRSSDRSSARFSGRNSGRSEGRDNERFENRSSGRSSFEKSMHRVICDDCGDACEVPFRPTSGKPIYCSDCFRKNEKSGARGSDRDSERSYEGTPKVSKEDIDQINRKLDKILKALKIN